MSKTTLNLNDLQNSCTLSPVRCAAFVEAASICLEHLEHQQEIELKVEGDYSNQFLLSWETTNPNTSDSYIIEEAIEDGAYGIAISVIYRLTPYQVIKQSFRGSGFDYWLGEKDNSVLFQEKARLEVSGILKGTTSQINQRLKEKLVQTKKSDNFSLPAFVIIVEFSNPLVKIKVR